MKNQLLAALAANFRPEVHNRAAEPAAEKRTEEKIEQPHLLVGTVARFRKHAAQHDHHADPCGRFRSLPQAEDACLVSEGQLRHKSLQHVSEFAHCP